MIHPKVYQYLVETPHTSSTILSDIEYVVCRLLLQLHLCYYKDSHSIEFKDAFLQTETEFAGIVGASVLVKHCLAAAVCIELLKRFQHLVDEAELSVMRVCFRFTALCLDKVCSLLS